MTVGKPILVLAVLCIAAGAQSKPGTAAEQRFFNIEDAIQHRVELSDKELSVLSSDKLMKEEQGAESPIAKLTQDGLEAAEIHICGSSERDLVVIGYGSPYLGANVGPFWIIRDLAAGPKVVLSAIALGLNVDTKRSNKCLNVQTMASTAVEVTTTEFHFNRDQYIVFRQKQEKVAQ
jgi:hypothetical protein